MLSILERLERIEKMLGIDDSDNIASMSVSAEPCIAPTLTPIVDDAVPAEVVEQGCKTCYYFSFGHCDKGVDISEELLDYCEEYEILAPNITRITGESQKKPKITREDEAVFLADVEIDPPKE